MYLNNLEWLVKHSIKSGSISKARGAELLNMPLIDMNTILHNIQLTNDGCVCAEINSRNCPVHQNLNETKKKD